MPFLQAHLLSYLGITFTCFVLPMVFTYNVRNTFLEQKYFVATWVHKEVATFIHKFQFVGFMKAVISPNFRLAKDIKQQWLPEQYLSARGYQERKLLGEESGEWKQNISIVSTRLEGCKTKICWKVIKNAMNS